MDRGQQLTSEWEARLAIEIAEERLAQMPRYRRVLWAYIVFSLVCGALSLWQDRLLWAGLMAAGVILGLAAFPLLTRYSQPRWEQAKRLNAEITRR